MMTAIVYTVFIRYNRLALHDFPAPSVMIEVLYRLFSVSCHFLN